METLMSLAHGKTPGTPVNGAFPPRLVRGDSLLRVGEVAVAARQNPMKAEGRMRWPWCVVPGLAIIRHYVFDKPLGALASRRRSFKQPARRRLTSARLAGGTPALPAKKTKPPVWFVKDIIPL